MDFLTWILTPAIATGQLIKLPLGSGGVTLLDLTVIFLCLMGLIKLKLKLKKPPLFIKSGILFILVAVLSLIFTPLHLLAKEYAISFFYTVRFTAYILLGWLIYSGAYPTARIKKSLIFSGIILTFFGLMQFIFLPDLKFLANFGWDPHYFRAASTFLDPNFLGSYLTLTLLLLIQQNSRLLFTLVYITLLLTFSRGAYLAFLASFLTLSFIKKSFKLGVLTIVLFLVLLGGFYFYQKMVAEPRGIDRTESASFRLTTWQQGATLFQTHPILGIGFNAYRYAIREYRLGDKLFLSAHGSSTNDSSFLFVTSTTGTIGLFVFLLFLCSLVWNNIKKPLLFAGLLGLIIQSVFANTLFYPPILLWIILLGSTFEIK